MTKKPNLADITKVTAGKTKTTGISPFSELEISKVYPNPDQPRKQFDDIEELAATIKEHGLLQPITVVKKDDRYMIISGERRYKAHLYNEAKTIKAHIINVDEDEIEELALIENIQRNNLTDLEFAKGVLKRWESGKYAKKSDLAKRLGKSPNHISKALSALKLDSEILEDIETNKKDISIGVMDEISRVKDKEVQKEVYEKYSAGEITRDEIKEFKEPKSLKQKLDYAEKYNLIYDEKKDWYKIPEKNQTKPINHTLKRFEDADNDLVEQAKVFSENFPRENIEGKSYPYNYPHWRYFVHSEHIQKELDNAPLLKHLWAKLKDGTHYKLIIHEQSDSENKDINEHINFIKDCIENRNGELSLIHKNHVVADGRHSVLNNRYEEIIFDLLKENLELKKEIEELKKSSIYHKDDEVKEIKTSENKNCLKDEKEIALLELLKEAVVIHYTNYDIDMGIDYKEAKKIIDKSKQDSIPFNVGKGTDERAYRLINTDIRTIKDDCIVFIDKEIK